MNDLAAYEAFAREIRKSAIIGDPWFDGRPRFREAPILLSALEHDAMNRAAEDVASVYDEMCQLVTDSPELLDSFFAMTPHQKAMWLASSPMWHGIARADVFITDEGLAVAELNCDTPTGEAEAVVLGAIAAARHPGTKDPNRDLEARFLAMIDAVAARELAQPSKALPTVGLVYPTEFTEDLPLVRLYKTWFERRGQRTVFGSPYNLGGGEEGAFLFDTPIAIAVRHYKTDWWGERASAWDDADVPDSEPLVGPLRTVFGAMAEGRLAVVNPFGAVLPQNKRAMAFFWEHIHRFSPHAQEVIQRLVPPTSRLETMHEEQLAVQREDWVIKSDYGAEGDEVIIGRLVNDAVWRATIAHARPGRWIAQRYFAARLSENGESVNHGVFLVAGEAAGHYARVQAGPTDERALSAPVLVD